MRVSCNQPKITFYAMIDLESGGRRKRLQATTGHSKTELVKEALVALKSSLRCTKSAKSWAG
jgi:hypothetical protein